MDKVSVNASARWRVKDSKGAVRRQGRAQNLVVTAGLELLASILQSGTGLITHMAIGDNGSSTTKGMTALQGTEHERVSNDSSSASGQDVTYKATFGGGLGSDVTVKEAGLFNASSGGTMLARFPTGEFTLFSDQTMEIEWTISFGKE